MSRLRSLVVIVVLAATGLLVPATAAVAATPLTATVTCDGATGTITTSTSGNLLVPGAGPRPVTVEFQRLRGLRITATTSTPLAAMGQPFTVTTPATDSGDVSATGYTGTFDPVTSLYYQEAIRVTYRNASTGAYYTYRDATCHYDQRTTVTLTCDPVAGTVTATVTGVNGQAGTDTSGRASSVGYHTVRIYQSTKDDVTWRTQNISDPWDVQHRLTRAADGSWADTGFVHTTNHPYRYTEELTVGVLDSFGNVVGHGTARCILFDGSQG
jgi:hypothetical protein